LEIALVSYYTSVITARPPAADAILPKADPALADKKLGAAVLQELQILRFLGNTAAVGRYEGMLKFITDRGNVSRTQIEGFYRQNVGAYISEVVDEKFGEAQRHGIVPKAVYADWKQKGVARGADALQLVKDSLTAFFKDPNDANYRALLGIEARYTDLISKAGDELALSANGAYTDTLRALNEGLLRKVYDDPAKWTAQARAYPADSRYNVFSTPYSGK
jgi:hypothetical protein